MENWHRGFSGDVFGAVLVVVVSIVLAACAVIESQDEGKRAQSSASEPTAQVPMKIESDTEYMVTCRAKGVPIPPDWKRSSPEWERHGNLGTILLTPNHMDKVQPDHTTFARAWSYASPTVRGACIALGRNGGSFQVICQSAATGHACFWGNDPNSPNTTWTPETEKVPLSSLRDPEQGFAPGTVPCTECHRGSNAFLVAPDDPTWATVLRPETPRPTFTTLVETAVRPGQSVSGEMTSSSPRFIPIGGKSVVLSNPPPTVPGCSGVCHESHYPILEKGHTVEGYVRIPRPMGPNCARTSPADHPAKGCYRY